MWCHVITAGGSIRLEFGPWGYWWFSNLLLTWAGQCCVCVCPGWVGLQVTIATSFKLPFICVFSVSHFAEMYAKKLGIRVDILNKTLWGDYFLNTKSKRIFKGAQVRQNMYILWFGVTAREAYCWLLIYRASARSLCLFSLYWRIYGQCTMQ